MVSSLDHFNEDRTAVFTKNMKFLVDQMKCRQFIETDDKFKVFFISDLTPYLLKNKIKKLESVKKNLMRSISHELLTYLNGAFGYINQLEKILPDIGESKNFCK